jgi:hypothetical protein
MRSEAIFRAKEIIANKYTLCQAVSNTTRQFHVSPKNSPESINDAFRRIASGSDLPVLSKPV